MYQMPVDDHSAPTDQMDVDNHASSSTYNQAGAIANTTCRDPNSISPSTLSTFLTRPPQSTVSMASTMTSVSQKRKVLSLIKSNAGSEGSKKRSRPLSATAQSKGRWGCSITTAFQLFRKHQPFDVTTHYFGFVGTSTDTDAAPSHTSGVFI